jgi:hypothetical protein
MQYTVVSNKKIALTTFEPNRHDSEDEFTKLEPVIKTGVPPVSSPTLGIRVRTVMGAWKINTLPTLVKSCLLRVTSNGTMPALLGGVRHSIAVGEIYLPGTMMPPKRHARPPVLLKPLPDTTITVPPVYAGPAEGLRPVISASS